MTQTDKEKLRMAKNLVKSNNKKIKKALEAIDEFLVRRWTKTKDGGYSERKVGVEEIKKIKEILES